MKQMYVHATKELLSFIRRSPSCFHVVGNARQVLLDAGFEELREDQRFCLRKGHSYMLSRGSSALIAFRLPPEEMVTGFSIIAAHTDSPSFKLKGKPEVDAGGYTTLNVEGYGGMLMAPWFDRPLSIAGRVFLDDGCGGLVEKLVDLDRDLVSIVDLAIHMNRKANEGIAYKIQNDLFPILALGANPGMVSTLVAQKLGVKPENIIDSDLFLYNRMEGSLWGADEEFFSSTKIDDLQCAFCGLEAMRNTEVKATIPLLALLDNEEVGSGSRKGALGDFLPQVIERIGESLGWDREEQCIMQAGSFLLSADDGHAFHPNYPDVCDKTNKPLPNGGVLVKYAANQKYTTDGSTGAWLKQLLSKRNIPYQDFYNNSNIPGGSTLGNLANQHYSIPSADIGCAILAMHSPYETGGTADTCHLQDAMRAFFERS